MSYRTVKRILGETSLERKCRFLLGAGMLILIATSFWFYWYLNANLIDEQNLRLANTIVGEELAALHGDWKQGIGGETDNDESVSSSMTELRASLRPQSISDMKVSLIVASSDPKLRALDDAQYLILDLLKRGKPHHVNHDVKNDRFRYYQPILMQESCIQCHHHEQAKSEVGEVVGMMTLSIPLDEMVGQLEVHRAILMATALVTAFLAMLGSYVIVRYVIVKPVLHLKDVSDEIARGNLELRADIRTGDEFEELSHAFNRMLRHLVTVQEELKSVNIDLDGKVDELAHVNLQLYEMNHLKDEFLATMSHELRTPLNSILGFSDVLAEAGNLEEKQKRYVSNIQISGRQLMALINDILDLAKIESGKIDLQLVEFDLEDFIERMAGTMQPLADKKHIELTWQVSEKLGLVFQDRGKLQQILNNLLSNALKFTPEGGRVSLIANVSEESETDMEIFVRDTGVGIRLEDQEEIFEKFRQGSTLLGQRDAITREHGGTGLGLSIVKELARLLGGEVLLESEFGKGSTFWVRIPIRHDPVDQFGSGDPLARYPGLNRIRSTSLAVEENLEVPPSDDAPVTTE